MGILERHCIYVRGGAIGLKYFLVDYETPSNCTSTTHGDRLNMALTHLLNLAIL